MKAYLNPIHIDEPPRHTQVPILCDQCSKRQVCSITSDYRKTATLIQNVLGDPQLDRELIFVDCGFTGFEFEDTSIFPTTYSIVPKKEGEELNGEFLNARYRSENRVKLLLKIQDFFVLFIIDWDKNFEKWVCKMGRELVYGINYELSSAGLESLQEPLTTWRNDFLQKKEDSKGDIINTTAFSAILRCEHYEPIRQNGVHNPNKFVNHNCGEGYQHIATFHKEDTLVEEAYDKHHMIGYYPWFVPALPRPKPPKPPKRRDDQ